jgi:hypothetical protein
MEKSTTSLGISRDLRVYSTRSVFTCKGCLQAVSEIPSITGGGLCEVTLMQQVSCLVASLLLQSLQPQLWVARLAHLQPLYKDRRRLSRL